MAKDRLSIEVGLKVSYETAKTCVSLLNIYLKQNETARAAWEEIDGEYKLNFVDSAITEK